MESELCRVRSGKQNPHQVIQWRGFNIRSCSQRYLKSQRSKQIWQLEIGNCKKPPSSWGLDRQRREPAGRCRSQATRNIGEVAGATDGAHRCPEMLPEAQREMRPNILPFPLLTSSSLLPEPTLEQTYTKSRKPHKHILQGSEPWYTEEGWQLQRI